MIKFNINKASLGQLKRNLHEDVGTKMEYEMRDEFSKLKKYFYSCSDKKNSIVYDSTAKIVGSEEWAVAASDTGGDWTWSSPPPFEKILEWVVKHSGLTDPKKQRAAAAGVQKKIASEGLESHYWVDRYLLDFTYQSGHEGSGVI